jgi:acetyl esterase/lipase
VLFLSNDVRSFILSREIPQKFETAFGQPFVPLATGQFKVRKQTLSFDSVHRLRLSLWRPQSLSQTACLIVVHAGGWDAGDRDEFSAWNYSLASSGIAVASIEYRLAPDDPWPAQREDLYKARTWLGLEAKGLGLDGKRFVVMGRSAGAQVALASAYKDPKLFSGVIAFYGPSDLIFAWQHAAPGQLFDPLSLLGQEFGGSPDQKAALYADASPIVLASVDSPATLLMHGGADNVVWPEHSERLEARLASLGQKQHVYVDVPWGLHEFDFNLQGPGGRLAESSVLAFLNDVFNGTK